MIKPKRLIPGCVLVVGMLATANVTAGTVSYTTGIDVGGGAILSIFENGFLTVPDFTDLSDLPQFDGTMGTLDQVSLRIEGELSYFLEIMGLDFLDPGQPNEASATATVGIGAGVPIDGSFQLRALMTESTGISCFSSNSGTEGPCNDFAGGNTNTDTEGLFFGSDMAAFMGAGTLEDLTVDLLFGVDNPFISNLLDADVIAEIEFFGDVTVTYTFSEVPIPAAAWLFGSAILGLAGVARRKKAIA